MTFGNVYAVELGIIILSTVYIAVRSMLLEYNFMDTSKGGKVLTVSAILALSLAISIINGMRNYSPYGDKYTVAFMLLILAHSYFLKIHEVAVCIY